MPAAILRADRGEARRRFGVAPDARCLLVMGGSQGARSINEAAIEAFAEAGSGGPTPSSAATSTSSTSAAGATTRSCERRLAAAPHAEDYTLLPYEPDLGDVLAACDLVLARSGGSIFEVVAAGRPAILVPYLCHGGPPGANAAWMSEAGAAETIADDGAERRRCSPAASRPCSRTRRGWRAMSGLGRARTPRRGPHNRRRGPGSRFRCALCTAESKRRTGT